MKEYISSRLRDYYGKIWVRRDFITFKQYEEITEEYANKIQRRNTRIYLASFVLGCLIGSAIVYCLLFVS